MTTTSFRSPERARCWDDCFWSSAASTDHDAGGSYWLSSSLDGAHHLGGEAGSLHVRKWHRFAQHAAVRLGTTGLENR